MVLSECVINSLPAPGPDIDSLWPSLMPLDATIGLRSHTGQVGNRIKLDG